MPASGAKIGFNQGLPSDSQRDAVWVDTYGAEFSRDVEPSVEGGNRTWLVMASCVRLYKAGGSCAASPDEPCCTRADKEVFSSIWSLRNAGAGDSLLTALAAERAALVSGGAWAERCSAIPNPTAFCVDGAEKDGRAGPFLLYNAADVEGPQHPGAPPVPTTPLHRCITAAPAQQHFFSTDAACEGLGARESTLGFMAARPGVEFVRALRRCKVGAEYFHALDLPCDSADPRVGDAPLGYVR